MKRDIVFLDLEATGTDPARDRIVQLALIRLAPDGGRTSYDTLVDPEMPIPPEASAIHLITDDKVRNSPCFRDISCHLIQFLEGADLGGFGVIRYDVPLLAAEFKRCGIHFDMTGRRVVDAMTIFHRLESRNLTAAYEFYCGKVLEGAHDAVTDTKAAIEVFFAQVERYQGRSDKPNLPGDIDGLADFCGTSDSKNVDARGKFVWRFGAAAFNFGKYQTRSIEEIVRLDRPYVEWLANAGTVTPEVAEICRRALAGEFPKAGPGAGGGAARVKR